MINFTLQVSIDFTSTKTCEPELFEHLEHSKKITRIANHFGVWLSLSKNTLKHGANHSSAILLWGFE